MLRVISSPRIPTKTQEIRWLASWIVSSNRWSKQMEQGIEMPALPLDEPQSNHEVACKFFRAGVSGGPGAITDRTADNSGRLGKCPCLKQLRSNLILANVIVKIVQECLKWFKFFPAAENPESAGECAKVNVPIFHIKWWSSDLWALRRTGSSKVHPP